MINFAFDIAMTLAVLVSTIGSVVVIRAKMIEAKAAAANAAGKPRK